MEWAAVFDLLSDYVALHPREYALLCLLCKRVRAAVAAAPHAKPLVRAILTLDRAEFLMDLRMEAGAAANIAALASTLHSPSFHCIHLRPHGPSLHKLYVLAHINILRTLELNESAMLLDIVALVEHLRECTAFHCLVVRRPHLTNLHPFHRCPRLRTVLIYEAEHCVGDNELADLGLNLLARDSASLRVLSAANTGDFNLELPAALRTLSLHSDGGMRRARSQNGAPLALGNRHQSLQPTAGAALRSLVVAAWSNPTLPLPRSLRSIQVYGPNGGRLLTGCNQLRRIVALCLRGSSFARGLAAADPPALRTLCLHDTALNDIAIAALPLMNMRTLHLCGRSSTLRNSLQTLVAFGAQLTSLSIHGLRVTQGSAQDATPPLDLSALVHVRRIDLRGRQSAGVLPPVSLQSLANLDHLSELSLRCCTCPSLHPLGQCANLRCLDLRNMSTLTDLSPLVHCVRLRSLHVSACPLVADVAPLVACPALTSLYLGGIYLLMDVDALTGSHITDIRIAGCGVNGIDGAHGWYE